MEIIIYKILQSKFHAIEIISESAIKLDGTVSTIKILSGNLFKQSFLTSLFKNLKVYSNIKTINIKY